MEKRCRALKRLIAALFVLLGMTSWVHAGGGPTYGVVIQILIDKGLLNADETPAAVTPTLAAVTAVGATSAENLSLTGTNDIGGSGVTTTFTGAVTDASILDGLVRAANVDGATNNFAINDSTSTIGVRVSGIFAWAGGNSASGAKDTGWSRISAGVVGAGNGTAGDTSGTLQLETRTFVDPAGAATVTFTTATAIIDVSSDEFTTGLIPANAYDVHVCTRNTSAIVGTTAVSYTVGIVSGDVDAFGTGIVFTDTTSTDMSDWTVTAPLPFSSSAREVQVAPDAGTLDTGTIQVVAFYKLLTKQTED